MSIRQLTRKKEKEKVQTDDEVLGEKLELQVGVLNQQLKNPPVFLPVTFTELIHFHHA